MSKFQYSCLLLAFFILLVAMALALYIEKGNSIPYLNVIAALTILVLVGAIFTTLTHLFIMHYQSSAGFHDVLPSIENGQVLLFIPVANDQFNRLGFGNKIIQIKHDAIRSGVNFNEERNVILTVTRKYGLFSTKKVNIQVDPNRECMLLLNNKEISRINGTGICIKINANALSVKNNISKMYFRIRYPELKNGVLSLACEYHSVCEGMQDALKMLRYKVERNDVVIPDEDKGDPYTITLYELLLKELFRSCPSNKNLVVPVDGSVQAREERLWINQSDGKLALSFLRTFSPSMVLNRKDLFKSEDKDLHTKIALVQNYIIDNGLTPDESAFPGLFEVIRRRFCRKHGRLSAYSYLHNNYCNENGELFSCVLRNEIIQDKKNVLAAIIAIAAYHREGSVDFADGTNNFLKDILDSVGSSGMMDEVKLLLDDLYGTINFNSYKLIGLKISDGLKEAAKSLGSSCTGYQLVNYARSYVMSRYLSHVAILKKVPCNLEFKSVGDITLFSGRNQVQNGRTEIVDPNVARIIDYCHAMSI